MDRQKTHALSVPEAKERLRSISREMEPATWVKNHPLESVMVAAVLGYLVDSDIPDRSSLKEAIRLFLKAI